MALVEADVRPRDVLQARAPATLNGVGGLGLAGDAVDHEVEQLGATGHVAIERHGPEAEPLGDAAHRDAGHALGVRELDGGGGEALDAEGALRASASLRLDAPEQLEAANDVACAGAITGH
jgi:hypothetical protein